jgi:hypothetical protein
VPGAVICVSRRQSHVLADDARRCGKPEKKNMEQVKYNLKKCPVPPPQSNMLRRFHLNNSARTRASSSAQMGGRNGRVGKEIE